MRDIDKEFVHLARLALEGKLQDVAALVRRALRDIGERRPDLAGDARRLIAIAGSTPLRSVETGPAVPVDADSRLELLRREENPQIPIEPIWPEGVGVQLEGVLRERANEAQRPLLTLDLSAVMSSFLGKTGSNIRVVLDYAQRIPSVLLLDEFDAIAKRRDDAAEIGELKRLVTVLVQAVDEWPAEGLLIAATNHPELLDPAVWRRFDRIVEFPLPTREEISSTISRVLNKLDDGGSSPLRESVATMLQGQSFAEVTRELLRMRRAAVLKGLGTDEALLDMAMEQAKAAPLDARLAIARTLQSKGHSQREVAELTGLSRDTIRKYLSGGSHQRRRNGATP